MHIAKLDVSCRAIEVARSRRVCNVWFLVEHLVDTSRGCACSLGLKHDEAKHTKRCLHHDDIGVEGKQGADADLAVDSEQPSVEKDHGHTNPRQSFDERVVTSASLDRFNVGPFEMVSRSGQQIDLAFLGGE